MSQNNSFMLLSQTKGPLIKLIDNKYAQISDTASQHQTLVASKAFFKSTPSLAPSIQSSINSYKNKNENYIDYEFEPIRQKPKSNPNLSSTCRELFTPDSLESTLSSCSLTDTDDDNNIINRDKEGLNLEDDEDYEQTNSKTDSGLSISPQLTHSSTSEDKHFDLDIDFEIDEEICQLTEKNESSIILEKIEKINRLQEKINDINLKIKSIDMNSNCSLGLNKCNSTSNEQMTNFVEQNEQAKQQDRLMDENFRYRNNQTRMGIRAQSDNFVDHNNEQIFDDDYSDDEKEQEQEEDNDNDDDDDDDQDYYTIVRQAQPVIKKYASTGYLFNRFGSYLAPIEEAPEEILKSSSNSSIVSTDSSDYLNQPTFYIKKTSASASCFNLELIKLKSEKYNHTTQQINNNNTTNANAILLPQDVCSSNLANFETLNRNDSVHNDVDLFWSNLPDSSLLIEREEFVDSSSLIESIYLTKEECKEESELLDDDNNDNESTPKVPEDNVERLRNIRDMFENRQEDDLIELKKVEKLQPSEKLKQTFLNDKHNINNHQTQQLIVTMDVDDKHKSINGDSMCMYESQQTDVASLSASSSVSSIPSPNNDDSLNQDNKARFEEGVVNENDEEHEESTKIGNKDIMPFADLNNVKTKFENITLETEESNEPKPIRSITPPREGADRVEIENEPMVRAADVVSVYERIEDALPDAGYIKSRREMFSSVSSPSIGEEAPRNKKSITPPRDDILKRVLKEKTPDRLDNVIRESDRSEDVLPSVGSIKQTAAIFNSGGGGARQRSIERSGITIEGELTEKGIAKSRLALFSDPSALVSPPSSTATDQELDLIKNASGIAKERLNLFKNLEQSNGQRSSPDRTVKKLKEFTPPPQMEPRQYIIIDKEDLSPTSVVDVSAYNKDEFVPESGLAKNRMKQYLDQASNSAETNETSLNETSELQGKGLAKSLLAKWKSIENIKDVSPPESKRHVSPTQDEVPIAGTAKSLLNKWQNIDTTSSNKENCERKGLKAFTPPPADQLNQLGQDNDNENDDDKSKQQVYEDELALLKGAAKNTLKKFEQSLAESNNRVKRTVTPPKDFISQIGQASVKTVFESQPVESNINAHYAEEEIIPPQGYAKNLKQKFLNLEKEAAKIETSSSKMNYVPKKFTSSTSPAYQNKESKSVKQQPSANSKQVGKLNGNGLLTTVSNGQNTNGQNNEKCSTCDKTVYAMEKIEADKKVYHKACFKCTSCNCPLKLGNFSSIKQTLYCTPHFLQLFARNGNYDEGFGLENYKRKWLPQQQNAQTTAAN